MGSSPAGEQGLVAGPPLKAVDRILRRWRAAKVRRYIPHGSRVLDIGCYDGAVFKQLGERVSYGVGIDPMLTRPVETDRYRLIPGRFPADGPGSDWFDVIALLAVLEHIPEPELGGFAQDCLRLLKPGGIIVITVPSGSVDRLLHWLSKAHLVAGMSADEHHGFQPSQVPGVFADPAVERIAASRFQFGLNNLFVFRKRRDRTDSPGSSAGPVGAPGAKRGMVGLRISPRMVPPEAGLGCRAGPIRPDPAPQAGSLPGRP